MNKRLKYAIALTVLVGAVFSVVWPSALGQLSSTIYQTFSLSSIPAGAATSSTIYRVYVTNSPTAPPALNWYGDGSEADPQVVTNADCTASGAPTACCSGPGAGTCTGAQTIQGEHWYANFTVSASSTLTLGNAGTTNTTAQNYPRAAIIVHSPGVCTVAGAIAGSAIVTGGGGGGTGGGGGGGGSGAAGGNGNSAGAFGANSNIAYSTGGNGGATGANVGLSCSSTITASTKQWLSGMINTLGICGGGAGGAGGSGGGAGGNGGGCVVLDCATVNFTGSINVSGANGGVGGSGTGGGGGGGGGAVVLAAHTFAANTGSVNIGGGSAGTGASGSAGNGGSGCVGWTKTFTLS